LARNKFNVDEDLTTEFNFKHLKRIMRYVVPYKKEMAVTMFLMLVSSVAGLTGPYLI
jgi:ATP-binding cassette subfamily B protein